MTIPFPVVTKWPVERNGHCGQGNRKAPLALSYAQEERLVRIGGRALARSFPALSDSEPVSQASNPHKRARLHSV